MGIGVGRLWLTQIFEGRWVLIFCQVSAVVWQLLKPVYLHMAAGSFFSLQIFGGLRSFKRDGG